MSVNKVAGRVPKATAPGGVGAVAMVAAPDGPEARSRVVGTGPVRPACVRSTLLVVAVARPVVVGGWERR